jgi:hypothetical protein
MKTTSCGNFSDDGKEFILTRPLLDRPWMNVLSNGNWCYVASHLGGGYSFVRNPTIGLSRGGRVLVVVLCDRGENIRIISARTATRGERKADEEGR